MKRIRIGGAGYSGDRIEPPVELAEKGGIDYLIFECLAERTKLGPIDVSSLVRQFILGTSARRRPGWNGIDFFTVVRMFIHRLEKA